MTTQQQPFGGTAATPDADSLLDWSRRGRADIVLYVVGAAVLLANLLFISQILGIIPTLALGGRLEGGGPASSLTMLMGFVWAFFTTPLIYRFLHSRPWWSLIGGRRGARWNQFAVGMGVQAVASLVLYAVTYVVNPSAWEYVGVSAGQWLAVAPLAFVLVFMQASAEEMVFRGYLMQCVRRVSNNGWVILLAPALVFAVPHIPNTGSMGGNPLAVLPYIVVGVTFGWLVYRTGSLWTAIGVHLMSNWTNIALVGNPDDVLAPVAPVMLDATANLTPMQATLHYTGSELLISLVVIGLFEVWYRRSAAAAAAAAN